MRYAKMLALAAVAVGAMMAFIGAGTASASKLCSTAVDPCPAGQHWPKETPLDLSLLGSAALTDTSGEPINTCTKSTVKGKTTTTGSSTETVTGDITSLLWEGCNFPTTTNKLGTLEIHAIAGSKGNGTLTSDTVTEVTINTIFFGSCVYGIAAGKSIGDLTEGTAHSATDASAAIFHANATASRLSGSGIACPETAKWVATYQLTEPSGTTLYVTAG